MSTDIDGADVEAAVRATFARQAAEARLPSGLAAAIRRRQGAQRRRATVLAAAATVAVLAASATAVQVAREPGTPRPAGTTAPSRTDVLPWSEVGGPPLPVTEAIRAEAHAVLVRWAPTQPVGPTWISSVPAEQLDVRSAGTIAGVEYYLARAAVPSHGRTLGHELAVWLTRRPDERLAMAPYSESPWTDTSGGRGRLPPIPPVGVAAEWVTGHCPKPGMTSIGILAVLRTPGETISLAVRFGDFHAVPAGEGYVLLAVPRLGLEPDPLDLRYRVERHGRVVTQERLNYTRSGCAR